MELDFIQSFPLNDIGPERQAALQAKSDKYRMKHGTYLKRAQLASAAMRILSPKTCKAKYFELCKEAIIAMTPLVALRQWGFKKIRLKEELTLTEIHKNFGDVVVHTNDGYKQFIALVGGKVVAASDRRTFRKFHSREGQEMTTKQVWSLNPPKAKRSRKPRIKEQV